MNASAPGGLLPYSLPPQADQHAERSNRMILSAAAQVPAGRAVVLGAGRCLEIPLAELAARFAQVVLVDLDAELLRSAVAAARLTPAERAKVTLSAGDLTGLYARLEQDWRAALAAATTPVEALDALTACTDGLLPRPATEPAMQAAPQPAVQSALPAALRDSLAALLGSKPFELVVASCLLSQLHAPAVIAAKRLYEERFAPAEPAWGSHPRWHASLSGLARRIEAEFMEQLPALTAPAGRIYLSESVSVAFVELAATGQWTTPGALRMTKSRDLADYVGPALELAARDAWTWVAAAPRPGARGRLFDVQALCLRVRAPDA